MYVILVSSAGTFFSVCDNRQGDKTEFFLHSVKSLCPGFEATALNFGECEKLCFQVSKSFSEEKMRLGVMAWYIIVFNF